MDSQRLFSPDNVPTSVSSGATANPPSSSCHGKPQSYMRHRHVRLAGGGKQPRTELQELTRKSKSRPVSSRQTRGKTGPAFSSQQTRGPTDTASTPPVYQDSLKARIKKFWKTPWPAWCYKFPENWRSAMKTDRGGNMQIPHSWKCWLLAPDRFVKLENIPSPPPAELMSIKLWPAVTHLLSALQKLKINREVVTEQSLRAMIQSFQPHDRHETVEVMLQLCKTAFSVTSPLTDLQKYFLMALWAYRTTDCEININSDPFALFNSFELKVNSINKDLLGEPATTPQQIEDLGQTLFVQNWRPLKSALLEYEIQSLDERILNNSRFHRSIWQFAHTFSAMWSNNQECDLATEFNVGEGDMLHSEYFAHYLRAFLGNESRLTLREQEQLRLLLDTVIVERNLTLTANGHPTNWREWLNRYEPRVDCIPGNEWKDYDSGSDSQSTDLSESDNGQSETEESGTERPPPVTGGKHFPGKSMPGSSIPRKRLRVEDPDTPSQESSDQEATPLRPAGRGEKMIPTVHMSAKERAFLERGRYGSGSGSGSD
ncbi:hypothetical protein [Endozoicomonas numazuensis]|uniref:Uncharacterized protein n=1 Tax=Endozoicomonas numazuensis TaxID=1137799 RepID=A0A081NLD6_9GAMM|nr:hypothetical protein [Endozoicomonas numazuensis]KEQ19259.1 hypothetical protein GZ78_04535 [Endozoicomonas numazuensis]